MALSEIYDVLISFLNFLKSKKQAIPKTLVKTILVVGKYHKDLIVEEKQKKEVIEAIVSLIKDLEKHKIEADRKNMINLIEQDYVLNNENLGHYINMIEMLFNQYISSSDEEIKKSKEQYEYVKNKNEFDRTGSPLISAFAKLLLKEWNSKLLETIRAMLKDKILCDLGSGHYRSAAYSISSLKLPIKKYIGVDKYKVITTNVMIKDGYAMQFVRADMLLFVSKLPDNCMNYLLCNLESTCFESDYGYMEKLNRELLRTTEKGGIIMGYGTHKTLLDGFKIIHNDGGQFADLGLYLAVKE